MPQIVVMIHTYILNNDEQNLSCLFLNMKLVERKLEKKKGIEKAVNCL